MIWTFVLLKLFVYDIDIYLVSKLAPAYAWILELKFFILLGVVSVLWLLLGNKGFFALLWYVLRYPFAVVLWRLPKFLLARWAFVVALAPGLYGAIKTFRTTFVLYSFAAIGALLIILVEERVAMLLSMAILGFFLLSHYWRSVRHTYGRGVFEELCRLARKIHGMVESGSFPILKQQQKGQEDEAAHRNDELLNFLVYNRVADIVAEKVSNVARSRTYDLYLLGSLVFTIALTVIVYAFEYLALQKFSPGAFLGTDNPSFWDFLGFSFTVLMTSDLSPISPSSISAHVLCHSEVAAALIVLVILGYLVLTSKRDVTNEEILRFGDELKKISGALETRLVEVYQVTLPQVEIMLLRGHASIVNALRRYRGMPELSQSYEGKENRPSDLGKSAPIRVGEDTGQGQLAGSMVQSKPAPLAQPPRTDADWYSGAAVDPKTGELFGRCHRCGRWAVRGAICILCGAATPPSQS